MADSLSVELHFLEHFLYKMASPSHFLFNFVFSRMKLAGEYFIVDVGIQTANLWCRKLLC